jgi:hypothetical protein
MKNSENIPIEVTIFKSEVKIPNSLNEIYFFTLNGQTQGYETRTFKLKIWVKKHVRKYCN